MTNKEAIEQLKIIKESLMNCGGCAGARQSLTCIDLAIKALEDVASLKRVISLLAIGGIPPEKQLLDFGYTKEDWVYMLKIVMGIIEENISCANSEDIKGDKE